MKVYNRIMEIFWLIMGIGIWGLTLYFYMHDMYADELKFYFMAGSMAIVLSIFRIFYRKNQS